MLRDKERPHGAWFCFMLSTAIGLYLAHFPLGIPFRRASYDVPFLFTSATHFTNIVVVYVDDNSLNLLGRQQDGTLDRRWHIRLLDRLTAESARIVVFDLAFAKADVFSAADTEFARAIRANGRVVLSATYESVLVETAIIRQIFPPHELFATNANRWGIAFLQPDSDHVVRILPTALRDKDSLPWASMLVADSWPAGADLTQARTRYLNHYRPREPEAAPFAELDFVTAVDTNALPHGFFRNKAVFIGGRRSVGPVGQERDRFETPLSAWMDAYPEVPGVVLHSTAFANLERGDWIYSPAPWANSLMIILVSALLCFILLPLRPIAAATGGLFAATSLTVAGIWLHRSKGILVPWLIPTIVQFPLILLWAIARNWLKPGRPIAFISYRRKEGEGSGYALAIWSGLRAHGLNSVFDVIDLRSGQWRKQIAAHIHKVKNVIVVISNESLSESRLTNPKDPFLWEIRLAHKLRKNLVFVIIAPYRLPTNLPPFAHWLRDYHWCTYHHESPRILISQVITQLKFAPLSPPWFFQRVRSAVRRNHSPAKLIEERKSDS